MRRFIPLLMLCGCSSSEPCPSGSDARADWLDRISSEYGGRSPAQAGFRFLDRCSFTISDKMLGCDVKTVRDVHGDSPYLQAAAKLGATTYACVSVGDGARVDYAIARVLGLEHGRSEDIWK